MRKGSTLLHLLKWMPGEMFCRDCFYADEPGRDAAEKRRRSRLLILRKRDVRLSYTQKELYSISR